MEKDKRLQLPECELEIMRIIWDHGPSVSQPEIRKYMGEMNNRVYGRTTISTWLGRLKQKKFVENTVVRGISYYSALIDESEYEKSEMSHFVKFWYKNSPAKMLSALLSNEDVDNKEAEEMRNILDDWDN